MRVEGDCKAKSKVTNQKVNEKSANFHFEIVDFSIPFITLVFSIILQLFDFKQAKPGFTNYQPQPKYSGALRKIELKGKFSEKF